MNEQELIERLADKEHASWANWMKYLFSQCVVLPDASLRIPLKLALHWQRQVGTPYAELSEREKQSDRDEVAHIMPLIAEMVEMTKQAEAERIFTAFMLRASAATMFQTEPSIHWFANEMRQDMIDICGVKVEKDEEDGRERGRIASDPPNLPGGH